MSDEVGRVIAGSWLAFQQRDGDQSIDRDVRPAGRDFDACPSLPVRCFAVGQAINTKRIGRIDGRRRLAMLQRVEDVLSGPARMPIVGKARLDVAVQVRHISQHAAHTPTIKSAISASAIKKPLTLRASVFIEMVVSVAMSVWGLRP